MLKEGSICSVDFNEGCPSISRMDDETLAGAYDYSGAGVVVDLAGGEGNFLKEVLRKNPATSAACSSISRKCSPNRTELDEYIRDGRVKLAPWEPVRGLARAGRIYVIKGTFHDFADGPAVASCATARA